MSSWRTSLTPTARRVLTLTCAGLLSLMGACATQPATTDEAEPEASISDTTQPAGPSAAPACAVAPPALLKQTLNLDVSAPTQTGAGTFVECTYLGGVGGQTVTIRVETQQDHASFADRRRASDADGQPTSDVTGVGDEAYQSSVEFGDIITNTLVARKGTVEVRVIAVATIDAEKALLTTLIGAMA